VQQIQLGLRENWQQFTLLVVINVFVGAVVGLAMGLSKFAGYLAVSLA
jgi:hypothetical protein